MIQTFVLNPAGSRHDPALGKATARNAPPHPGCGGRTLHAARVRRRIDALADRQGRRESRGRQLPLRLQGCADRSGLPAPPRPDERGAPGRTRPARKGCRRGAPVPGGDHPRVHQRVARDDRGRQERRAQLRAIARPHLHRTGETDPHADRRHVRIDHGALQGGLRARAARAAERRAVLADALHVRHAVLHPRRHRHGAADRRLQA